MQSPCEQSPILSSVGFERPEAGQQVRGADKVHSGFESAHMPYLLSTVHFVEQGNEITVGGCYSRGAPRLRVRVVT